MGTYTGSTSVRSGGVRTRCRRRRRRLRPDGLSRQVRSERIEHPVNRCVEKALRCAVKTAPDSAMDFGGGFDRPKIRLPRPPPPGVTPPGVPWGECNPELRSAPTLFESAHVERYTRCSKQCRGEHSPPRVSTRSAALTTPLDRACGTAHRGARRSARQSTAASAENRVSQCPVEHSVHAP